MEKLKRYNVKMVVATDTKAKDAKAAERIVRSVYGATFDIVSVSVKEIVK